MSNGEPYTLTPADIMDLRASVRWRLSDRATDGPTAPYIMYAREDPMAANAPGYDPEAFVIHTQGHMRAISKRPEVLMACLRAEWAEPGFMVRIMDTRENVEFASLNPDMRAAEVSRRRFEEKAAREYAEEQRLERQRLERTGRAPSQPDPKSINVEELFDD